MMDVGGQLVAVGAGQTFDVQAPPQGGYVLYVGVRARNLDPCGVMLRGQLLDATSGAAASDLDGRKADLHPTGDGWWAPDVSDPFDVPNVPTCPDYTGGTALGRPLLARVQLTDRAGRTATATSPSLQLDCPRDACYADCRCRCAADYDAQSCEHLDGGVCLR